MRILLKILSPFLVFSLCLAVFLGGFLAFTRSVQAGFFSSLFVGDEALADANANTNSTETDTSANTVTPPPPPGGNFLNIQNSQLSLQANASSASIFQDKNAKNDQKDDKKGDRIDASADVNIDNNALRSAIGFTGDSDGRDAIDSSCGDINVYKVTENDSISKIAKLLDVPEDTVLAANDMKKKLVKDDVLFIPNIPGIEHTVAKGQTLQSIAKFYKADINDIAFCNDISPNAKLKTGISLMIPYAYITAGEGSDKSAPSPSSAISRDAKYYVSHPLQFLVDYFINPVPTGHKTQGLHGPGHRGVDIGANRGTPIYASAKGIVSITCKGWCGAYGTMAIIEHPDKNTKTLYAHMSKIVVHTGDEVAQGQTIGYVGSTGRSTGPHLHFEVFYYKNPGADGSWKSL